MKYLKVGKTYVEGSVCLAIFMVLGYLNYSDNESKHLLSNLSIESEIRKYIELGSACDI